MLACLCGCLTSLPDGDQISRASITGEQEEECFNTSPWEPQCRVTIFHWLRRSQRFKGRKQRPPLSGSSDNGALEEELMGWALSYFIFWPHWSSMYRTSVPPQLRPLLRKPAVLTTGPLSSVAITLSASGWETLWPLLACSLTIPPPPKYIQSNMHITGGSTSQRSRASSGFHSGTDDQPPALTSELPTDPQQRPGLQRAIANVSAGCTSETTFQERAGPYHCGPTARPPERLLFSRSRPRRPTSPAMPSLPSTLRLTSPVSFSQLERSVGSASFLLPVAPSSACQVLGRASRAGGGGLRCSSRTPWGRVEAPVAVSI